MLPRALGLVKYRCSQLSNTTFQEITRCPFLTHLNLGETAVTVGCVARILLACPLLQSLDLHSTTAINSRVLPSPPPLLDCGCMCVCGGAGNLLSVRERPSY